ncbi:MAG: hypothetical protein ACI8RD_006325 [Bacillariaceae sp.]|jgi:hypothetical protein
MADFFSPYQIDYSVKNTSKTFGFSKKKIIFKFGIANPPAVEAGEAGADCRGSEHEVIFTWSLNSGKRQILADGKDVHYSETGQNGWTSDQVFQHHFNIKVAGLSGPLRAHLITQPANKDVPHIKPFDLRINGISYFSMPRIFQLGTPQMVTRPVKGKGKSRGGGGGNRRGDDDGHLTHEEREAIAAAKLASMQDIQRSQNQHQYSHSSSGFASAPPVETEDLLSFGAPPAPPQMQQGGVAYGQPPPQPPQPQYSNYSLGGSMVGSVQSNQNPYASQGSFASHASQPSQQSQPPPQQQQQGMMGSVYGQQQPPPQQQQQQLQQSQQAPFYGQQPPPPAQQPPQPPQQQLVQSQQQGGSFYGQQPPAPLQQQGMAMYGQQPSALAPAPFDPNQLPLTSPSNQTIASYQSYGSAPSFAQPPQQQRQQQQGSYNYGQPPPNQGY